MTRDAVLEILRKENGYMSGEKISSLLGVSRAAVNTAVKTLRGEGYEIRSVTNKGYRLENVPDSLTPAELAVYLPKERMELVKYRESVDSTNNCLREMAFSGAVSGQVVLANEQTDGRGQRGRRFISPKDKGIYLSMLFRPETLPSDMNAITVWTAVAVSNAIENVCGVRPSVKWVNDLLLNQKKLCGILTEMSVESESGHVQQVVIGIGLNVNEDISDFPEELRERVTSLKMETGQTFRRAQLAAEIIRQLDIMCSVWPSGKQENLPVHQTDGSAIKNRRSIRKYKSDQVPDYMIEEIIKAGILAPSSKNRQPWRFVIVSGEAKKDMLAVMKKGLEREKRTPFLPESAEHLGGAEHTLHIMEQAPVVIFIMNVLGLNLRDGVTAEERISEICNAQSIGAAAENMTLTATRLGLGSLWICDTYFAYDELCEWLHTEGELAAAMTIGYADECPAARPRKKMEDVVEWRRRRDCCLRDEIVGTEDF